MAKGKKITTDKATVTDADFVAVDAVRKEIGPVTLKGMVAQAAKLGDIPTSGGIERMLMTFFFEAGIATKKSGGKKVDVKPAFNAWADTFYNPDVVAPRKRPDKKTLDGRLAAYGKFANLPLAVPYDAWPIAQRVMAERNLSLLGRTAKLEKLREAHPETAPSTSELNAAFTAKAKRDVKYNISGALRGICSAIEKKLKDDKFVAALPDAGISGTYFKVAAEALASLRFHITESDKQAKVKGETDKLLAKLAGVADLRKGKNGAAVH